MKTMTKTTAAAAIAILTMAAAPSQAAAWTCGARSATGSWGLGWSGSLYRAKRVALYQCAARTPRGHWCRITYCV